jgi:polysaccharide export outer membrane protein
MMMTRFLAIGTRRLMIPAMAIAVAAVAVDSFAQTSNTAGQQQSGQQQSGKQQPAQPPPQTTKPAPPAGPLTPAPDKTGATPGPQPAGTDTTATAPSTLKAPVAGAKPGAKAQPEVAPVQGTAVPADYLIGPDDVLQVVFWQEKDLSAEVVVRPDGKISLPLINEVQASGATPAQLRTTIMQAASRFVTDPSLTIFVKTINSRKVFVMGQVNKPGQYPLNDSMTVLQMLATAGGLAEYAKGGKITVTRTEQGQTKSFKFNYNDVRDGKNLQQNIVLKPGDTIVVP